MKKIGRVFIVLALIALVAMPLAAAGKVMNVTWQWELSDPEITQYRYQLDGEDPNGWTVVDGKVDSYSLEGLDPYTDYALYVQATYDGIHWSQSACAIGKALLVPEPVVEEEVPSGPVFVFANDYELFAGNIAHIEAYTDNASITYPSVVTPDDIRQAAAALVEAYPEAAAITYRLEEGNVLAISYPEMTPDQVVKSFNAIEKDLKWYINQILATMPQPVEEQPAAPVAEVVPQPVEEVKPVKAVSAKAPFAFKAELGLGGEFAFDLDAADKKPVIYPRANVILDFENIIAGKTFGLGVRADAAFALRPYGRDWANIKGSDKFSFDFSADGKLMGYANLKGITAYFGAGAGAAFANPLYGNVNPFSEKVQIIVTGVLGADVKLGKHMALTLEANGRWYPQNAKRFTVAATVGFGYRF